MNGLKYVKGKDQRYFAHLFYWVYKRGVNLNKGWFQYYIESRNTIAYDTLFPV